MADDVEKRVCDLLAKELKIDADRITMESTPEGLEIDSLSMIEMIFALEEEFDVTIPFNSNDSDANNDGFKMTKVGDLVEVINELTAGQK